MNEQSSSGLYRYASDPGQHLPAVAGPRQVAVYNPYTLPERGNDDLDLRRMWHIINRYRWLILSVVAVSVITVTIITLMMRPVYRATALVELKPNPALVSLDASGGRGRNALEFRNTQKNILRSEAVTQRVIKEMELSENPEFTGEIRQFGLGEGMRAVTRAIRDVVVTVSSELFPSGAADDPVPQADSTVDVTDKKQEARAERAILSRYMTRLDVAQIERSDLIQVSFESFDPETAARLANAHTREYIRFTDERRFSSTSSAKRYLQEQIDKAETDLAAAEKTLTDFARQHNVVDVEDRGNVMEARFEDLSRALTETRQERTIAEVTYKQAVDSETGSLPAVLSDPVIRELRTRKAELRAEYEEMGRLFKDTYPKMLQLKSKINEIDAALRAESEQLVSGLKNRYLQLQEEQQKLSEQLEEQRTKLLDLKERAISYNILKREWEASRELYSGLLSRQKDFSVASGLEFNEASILDKAVVPTDKHKPDNVKNVAVAGVFGLMGGVGIAFLLAFLDNTFKTREELEQTLGIPFMGIVPNVPSSKDNQIVPISLISAYQPANALAEAIRSIRTGMLFSRPEHVPKKILITSTTSGEGKSTVAINLALILAQGGSKVLIIDTDLRRPVVGKWLQTEAGPGLADYLEGKEADVVQSTSFENLFVVPAGWNCVRPTDLLGSLRMRDYLSMVSERFDFVILDGPPCLGVADSMLLSAKVDGTLLVVKANSTEKYVVAETVNRLRMVNAPLIGSILNFVNLDQPEYGHYGKYYGYDTGREHQEVEYQQQTV